MITPRSPEDARKRVAYWNADYANYWKLRVDEAAADGKESELISGDAKTPDSLIVERMLDLVPVRAGDHVLIIGCGFGPEIPHFIGEEVSVTGLDISRAMLEMVPADLSRSPRVSLCLAESENLPMAAASFDHVVVMAAFEAFHQHVALPEILRVCKSNGYVLITGKNGVYCEDDDLALVAEVNARKKGHPNFFTDFDALLDLLHPAAELTNAMYFVRRGDMTALRYLETRPTEFYEYALLARRTSAAVKPAPSEIAYPFSRTWEKVTVRQQ